MTSFVATKAPTGWKLGRWTKIDNATWEEKKLDNPSEVYLFDAATGGDKKSTAIRLAMRGTATEVLITETSVQIFVDGRYFGEYMGYWDNSKGGGARAAPAPAPAPARAAPPPAEVTKSAPMKSAPPPAATKSAPPPAAAPAPAAVASSIPERPKKASDLDSSPASIEKLFSAAKSGNLGEVQRLLDSRVDPDGQNREGVTALYGATQGSHKAVIQALLAAGADPSIGKGGKTPTLCAYEKGDKELIGILFQATFETLEKAVGPGGAATGTGRRGLGGADEEVSEQAIDELREVTGKLAKLGQTSGVDGWKVGSQGAVAGQDSEDIAEFRKTAVRVTMMSIKEANAPVSP